MIFEDVPPVAKEQAERVFGGTVSHEIVHALLGVTYHESDWEWVQDRCLSLLDSPLPDVRNTAISCLGHLARIHRKIDKRKVLAALAKKLADPETSGRAEDALDDIEMFTKESV